MENKYFSLVLIVMFGMGFTSSICPKDCACSDTRVDCHSRHLQTIPGDISESATSLDLHDNEIRAVEDERLSSLHQLITLSLHINHISELKSPIFANLTKLIKLQVGYNDIEMIDDNVFTDLVSLQDLDLTNNKITKVTEKFKIPSLRRLILRHNQITSLQDNSLNGVRNLHNLILSNNKISYISKLAWANMTNLSYLALQGNPIKNVDHIFEALETLSYLDVSSCQLINFPEGLPWTLRRLNISNNNLTILASHALYSTRYLEVLIMDNNNIQAIQDDALLYTPYLTEIHISQNKIRWLPQIPKNIEILIADENDIHQLYQFNFAHDSAMKKLSLNKNKISDIRANTFSRLANLTILLLGHNAIKDLKNMTFAGLRQLITLNLEFNPVEKIESRAFGGLQKLEQLKLANMCSENNKTGFQGIIFQDTPSLSYLDLQSSTSIINDILNSSELLRSLHGIQHLNLINGSLETLSMEIRTSLPNLQSLNLSDNPWKCDNKLAELHDWIYDSPTLFQNSQILCASPGHLRGKPIQEVSMKELTMFAVTSFSSSSTPENTFNTTIIYSDHPTETETNGESHSRYLTQLSPKIIETTLPLPNYITTSALEQTFPSFVPTFSIEQSQVLPSVTSVLTATPYLASIIPPLLTPLLEQFITSTTSGSIIKPTILTALSMSKLYSISEGTLPLQCNTATRSFAWATSSPWMQVSTNTSDDLQVTSSVNVSAKSQNTLSHSATSWTDCCESTTHSTLFILPQIISKIIMTTLSSMSDWPSSVIVTTKASTIQTYATKSYPQTNKSSHTSTAMILPLNTLPSTLAPSMTIPPIKQLNTNSINSKSTPPISDQLSINTTQFETLTTQEISVTSRLGPLTDQNHYHKSSSNLGTSKSSTQSWHASTELNQNVTTMSESTALQETTGLTLDNQSILVNSTNSGRNNNGYPIKPPVKTDNRLPALSNSADIKLRAIIVTVSIVLLALVVGLFIVVATVRYCKQRKHVSFDEHSQHMTETSDTVFIIRHMQGEQTDNLNTDTTRDCTTSAVPLKDCSGLDNNSKQTKKGLKFKRQHLSASAVISKTSFDCIKGQTEDDSELLMYSWK